MQTAFVRIKFALFTVNNVTCSYALFTTRLFDCTSVIHSRLNAVFCRFCSYYLLCINKIKPTSVAVPLCYSFIVR